MISFYRDLQKKASEYASPTPSGLIESSMNTISPTDNHCLAQQPLPKRQISPLTTKTTTSPRPYHYLPFFNNFYVLTSAL
nr:hypothetical protein HmN_000953800 [Hymenolepis microstoma]